MGVLAQSVGTLEQSVGTLEQRMGVLEQGQGKLEQEVSGLRESVDVVRYSQMRVELEQFPRIAAAIDRGTIEHEKNDEQDKRIVYLENKADLHDTRLYTLEKAVIK